MSRVIFVENGSVKLDFLGSYDELVGATAAYTFEDINLGAAAASSVLVIGAICSGILSGITAVDVNGNSATEAVSKVVTNASAGLWYIQGESGNGDVTLHSPNPATVFAISLWRLRGVRSASPNDTDNVSGSSSSLNLSFDVPRGGAGFGVIQTGNRGGTTWSGLVKDADFTTTSIRGGAASNVFDTAQAPLAVSASYSADANTVALVGASWR